MRLSSLLLCSLLVSTACKKQEPSSDVEGAGKGSTVEYPWTYFTTVDHGIRLDSQGEGWFKSERNGGTHSGIDFLMQVGTPLIAPCDGKYVAGNDPSGYGRWVQFFCTLPSKYNPNGQHTASMLFGHLSEVYVTETMDPYPLKKGKRIGLSGKSGNASGSAILPHLHFDIVIHDKPEKAYAEGHQKGEQGAYGETDAFMSLLKKNCITKFGITAKQGFSYGNRIDPYVLFLCLSNDKPPVTKSGIQEKYIPWSSYYASGTKLLNIDTGLKRTREEYDADVAKQSQRQGQAQQQQQSQQQQQQQEQQQPQIDPQTQQQNQQQQQQQQQ